MCRICMYPTVARRARATDQSTCGVAVGLMPQIDRIASPSPSLAGNAVGTPLVTGSVAASRFGPRVQPLLQIKRTRAPPAGGRGSLSQGAEFRESAEAQRITPRPQILGRFTPRSISAGRCVVAATATRRNVKIRHWQAKLLSLASIGTALRLLIACC